MKKVDVEKAEVKKEVEVRIIWHQKEAEVGIQGIEIGRNCNRKELLLRVRRVLIGGSLLV